MSAEIVSFNDKLLLSKETIDDNPHFQKQKKPEIQNGFISITKNKTKWWRCLHSKNIKGKKVQCICIISNSKYSCLSNEQKINLKNQ